MSNFFDQFEEPARSKNYFDQFDSGDRTPASVKAGRGLMEVPRQVGLAGRYAVEGTAQVADILAEPIRNFVVNPIIRAFGGTPITSQYEASSRLLDSAGMPSPENANERVIADASRMVAGAGTMAGLLGVPARAVAAAPKGFTAIPQAMDALTAVRTGLGSNPLAQATGAAGAGLAGGAVREAGGGPAAQFGASLAGGLVGGIAGPAIANKATSAGRSAVAGVRDMFAPKQIEGELRVQLKRAGINWDAISESTRTALLQDVKKAIYNGEELSPDALRRLADFRNIGATPLVGDLTMDPGQLTLQRNLSKQMANTSRPLGGPDLPNLENQNAQRVIGTLQGVADSPMDTYGTGQAIKGAVLNTDNALKVQENALYRQARDTSGRSLELDRGGFVDQVWANLAENNRAPWLPDQIKQVLNTLSKGDGTFTVDTIDQLKTLLAQESRATMNGNTRAAIKAVRDALENVQPAPMRQATGSTLPITGQMGVRVAAADSAAAQAAPESLAAFDKARQFARNRREWQESAKFIEDALNDAAPDTFVKSHVIGASVEELAKMAKGVAKEPTLREAIRKQLIEHIMARGRVDSDVVKFTSAGMNDALKQIGDRKLALFFSPEEIGKIRSAVNVGRYIQAQPIGSAVNNSNSGAMVFGRLADVLLKGSGIPFVGPLVADPLKSLALNMQARQVGDVSRGLLVPQPAQPVPYGLLALSAGIPYRDQ